MRLKVFLCHAKEDKVQVRRLYRDLKGRGFLPWLDEEDLIGGQDWDFEIQKAVISSDVVIVCLSHHSVSKTGYVQKEIRVALDAADHHPKGQIFIIPLRLCPCEIPERLNKWQAIDLFKEGGLDRLERSLLTRTVVTAIWNSSEDDPTATEKDTAKLKDIRAALTSASPPTTREVLEELEQSVNRLKNKANYENALQVCMATRTIAIHVYELYRRPEPHICGLLEKVDGIFDGCLKELQKVKDTRAKSYVESVRYRSALVKNLRANLPRRR